MEMVGFGGLKVYRAGFRSLNTYIGQTWKTFMLCSTQILGMSADDLPESPLLSESLREFLEAGQPNDDSDENRKRYRTRKRVKEIIAEFHRLLHNWPESEIKTAFSDPDGELEQGMKAIIALFYLANRQREFEQLVEDGVLYGEQRMNSNVWSVNCELKFRRKETTREPEVLMRILDGDHVEPSNEEKGIILELIDEGEIPEEYLHKLLNS